MSSPRKRAIEAGERSYFTGNPCPHGHVTWRRTTNGKCLECERAMDRRYYRNNAEECRRRAREWKARNKDRCRSHHQRWREEHPEEYRDSVRRGRAAWAKKPGSKAKVNAWAAKRRAAKQQRTPPWADLDAIARVYADCPDGHHVDHVVPLQGATVSGLHVPWNLQVIPAKENLRKGNSLCL